ncbi:hypothetical protein [Komagataeibacter swingsii]|uniref:hypothetical protein n=1 Tax=Komagataeibacter swingsii TaxID=215220 RepID=UPI00142E7F3E|nr:hypothetical protein [Komagataeibacter swingsii]
MDVLECRLFKKGRHSLELFGKSLTKNASNFQNVLQADVLNSPPPPSALPVMLFTGIRKASLEKKAMPERVCIFIKGLVGEYP